MRISFSAVRDDRRLLNEDGGLFSIDSVDEIEIPIRELFDYYRSCCVNDDMPEFLRALLNYNNLPRHMKLSYNSNTDEWSLTLVGFRGKLNNNRTVASFYVNGGRSENKVVPYATFELVVGSVIIFRPPPEYRQDRFMRNLEFHVVAVDADDEEEAEVVPVVPVVDAGVVDADDVVEEEAEEEEAAEVVPVVVVVDEVAAADADDEEEQSIPAAVVVEEEEIEELTVKSQNMIIQERQNLAEKSGQVISLLDTPDKATVVIDEENTEVEVVPSFEEIRSVMGFSPLNNTSDPVPHDEDLLSWSLRTPSPRPSRRSIYDPIRID